MVRFFPIALVIDRWTMLFKVFRWVNINNRTIYFFIEIVHFIEVTSIIAMKNLTRRGWRWEEKMGGSQYFFQCNIGGLERSKAGLVGVFYIKSKKLSCVIFWYYVWRRFWLFLNDRRVYPKNTNAIRLGSGIYFASKTFFLSPPVSIPRPT